MADAFARPMPDQYFQEAHYPAQDHTGLPTPPGSSRTSIPPTPSEFSIIGRKRSRGDNVDADDDEARDSSVATFDRGEPVYGPGMTLVYPNDPSGHYATDAGTQSGTWLEGRQNQTAISESSRPIMPTRKSQRLDTSVRNGDDEMVSALSSLSQIPGTATVIDEASRMLGVSWTRMDQAESTRISQRAYTRWIERHYPQLSHVEVWFENSAIPGYLGKATNSCNGLDEYYLWSMDLHQAVLVTRNPTDLILKLGQPLSALSQATEIIFADIKAGPEPAQNSTEPSAQQSASGMDVD